MGLEVDPNNTLELVLPSEGQDPKDAPTFVFRFPTAKEFRAVQKHFAKSREATTDDDVITNIVEGMKVLLVAWQNVKGNVPFNLESIEDAASYAELLVIRENALHEMTVTEVEKKRQGYVLLATSANSVKSTATASV